MGIYGNFNLPSNGLKPEKVSAINRQALEKEEKRLKEEKIARAKKIKKLIDGGMLVDQAIELVDQQIAEVASTDFEKFKKMYPPENSRAA